MRNLKKVLSLALALVMLLGMMVVGAGAATKFQDVDKIQNKEAVAVLVGMGIMKGREDGTNFDPTGTLTRAEAAMMIAQMDLGVDAAAALKGNGSNTFSDVWAGYWAEGAIDYCVEQGYIKGDGAGHFLPGNPVSSVEFGSMALRLLGYDANNEGLVGDQWAVKAASLIRKAGLATSVAANTQPMTRDEMAQMAFNTLTAETVEYNGLNISGDNITITSPATVRRHSANQSNVNTTYDREPIKSNITPIRFCEERFPTLKLDRSGENEFKEAYSVWTYRGLEIEDSKIALNCISTTQAEGNNTWLTNVKYFAADTSVSDPCEIYVNGTKVATKDGGRDIDYITSLTDNGRLVQVYVDPDDLAEVEKVVVIDTVPGEVTKVASDGKLTIKLLATDSEVKDKDTGAILSADVKRNDLLTTGDKTVIDGEFKKGDLVLVKAYGLDKSNRIYEKSTVAEVFAPEKREEFVIRKNYDKTTQLPVSVDTGDKTGIEEARNIITEFNLVEFEVNNKDKDSVLYLDQYGYIVKIVDWVDTTPKDGLIAVKDIYQDVEGRKIVDRVAGVISNGETIELDYEYEDTKPTVGTVYVYTDGDKDGKYELTPVEDKTTATSNTDDYVAERFAAETSLTFKVSTKGNADIHAGNYFYADSVKFIFTNKDGVTVLNGRQNYTGKVTAGASALNSKGEIIAVFLEAEPDIVSLDDIIFVWTRRSKDEVVTGDKQTVYYGYEAYESNGSEIDEFFGTENDMVGETGVGMFYKKDIVKDGDVTAYKPTGNKNDKIVAHTITNAKITYANGTNGDAFIINGDTDEPKELLTTSRTKVIDLDTDGTITTPAELNKTMNKDDKTVHVAVVYTYDKDTENYEVHTIFVTDVDSKTSFKDKTEVIPNAPKQYTVSITPVTGVKIEVTTASGKVVNNGDKFDENTVLNVKATATDAGKNTALTVDGKVHDTATLTLTKSVVISATEPSEKPAEAEKALNVVLDKDSAAAKANVTIAGVHLVTADEAAGSGEYGSYDENDLVIKLTVPSGVATASGTPKLTWSKNGMDGSVSAATLSGGEKVVKVAASNNPQNLDATLTYTLADLAVAVSHDVVIDNQTGSALKFAAETSSLDETSGADLMLNITAGLPYWAAKVKVTYNVTGLKDSTLIGDPDGNNHVIEVPLTANGVIDAHFTNAAKLCDTANADPAAKEVKVTITGIKVSESKVVFKSDVEGYSFAKSGGGDITVTEAKFTIPALTATLSANAHTATVNYKIENVKTDDPTNAPLTFTKADLTAGSLDTAEVSGTHYTATGEGPVTITITSVAVTKLKGTAIKVTDKDVTAYTAALVADATGTTTGAPTEFAVANGENTAALYLSVKPTTGNWAQAKKVILTLTSGAKTMTMESTSAVATGNGDAVVFTISANALKGITGENIVFNLTYAS